MTARRGFLGLFVAAALLVPLPAGALDAIGDINVDTIWRTTDSPVNLTGDVTVADHATLTIEPGVQVVAAASDLLGAGTDVAVARPSTVGGAETSDRMVHVRQA